MPLEGGGGVGVEVANQALQLPCGERDVRHGGGWQGEGGGETVGYLTGSVETGTD